MKPPAYLLAGLAVTASLSVVVVTPADAARQHTVGAFFIDYAPDPVTINQGDGITFANTDPVAGVGHSFTQVVAEGAVPRFDTGVIAVGDSVDVAGVSDLGPGEYLIRCTIHAPMRAHLSVGPPARPPTEAVAQLIDGILP